MNKKIVRAFTLKSFAFVALTGFTFGQTFITPTATFASPGSQQNTPGASLELSGTAQAPGSAASALTPITQPFSFSSTLAYECFGSTTFPSPGTLGLSGAIRGLPNRPFLLAFAVTPGSTMCGGFAGWPCLTGPMLFSNLTTPYGQYHLGPNLQVILDGIGGTAPPGVLDASGNFPLSATLPVDTVTNGGFEYSIAIQGLVLEPNSSAGFRLTAATTVAQWVFYL